MEEIKDGRRPTAKKMEEEQQLKRWKKTNS
jgi:hypothetical protein